MGVFRYNVIAPLLENGLMWPRKRQRARDSDWRTHHAGGKKWTISERTLRNWLARHRTATQGLKNQRMKISRMKAWPKSLGAAKAAERMRSAAFRHSPAFEDEGVDVSRIAGNDAESAFESGWATKRKDFADRGAFHTLPKSISISCGRRIAVTELAAGPLGLKADRQTNAYSFIDDCSRFCVHGQFTGPSSGDLLDCFKKALLARGKPGHIQ